MNLYWWNDRPNFGDAISPVVVEWATGEKVVHAAKTDEGKVLGIGSILQFAGPGDCVWGSGVHPFAHHRYLQRSADPSSIKFLAVRGPITRDAVFTRFGQVPRALGDPALLMPLIYKPCVRPGARKVGMIPHFSDRHLVPAALKEFVIDVTRPWDEVINEIVSSERIISSSLHGIIVAEAYGVPATWARLSSKEGSTKFWDYYLSTGRTACPVYSIDLTSEPSAQLPSLKEVSDLQNGLLEAARAIPNKAAV